MKRAQIYQAEDGETFDTAEKCQDHEHLMFVKRLCGRNDQEIYAALNRMDTGLPLAADLERAGNMIAAKRRADGDMKRRKAPASDDAKFAAIGAHLQKANK